MTNPLNIENLPGRDVVDPEGNKVGSVSQVYLDDQTSEPTFITVKSGLFGMREHFVPLYGASASGSAVVVAVSKDVVDDAPSVENDGSIDESEQQRLYDYYNGYLQHLGGTRTSAETAGAGQASGGADDAMTRSEEQLRVGTQNVETGRARLRKYVVTENVTTTVPVSHEEVRVEREPITEANRDAAMAGQDITEAEHEVVLHAEQPVVAKEAVPVERVRLSTETVTENETVSADVRKEQIEEDTGGTTTGR